MWRSRRNALAPSPRADFDVESAATMFRERFSPHRTHRIWPIRSVEGRVHGTRSG